MRDTMDVAADLQPCVDEVSGVGLSEGLKSELVQSLIQAELVQCEEGDSFASPKPHTVGCALASLRPRR